VISNSGSYYLIENLVYTDSATPSNGVTIAADDVKLDLRGFSLISVTGGVNGIQVIAPKTGDPTRFNITILNGVVRNWSLSGIDTTSADDSQIIEMKAIGNGKYGMIIGQNSLVEKCSSRGNAESGLEVMAGGTIVDCKSSDNGWTGGTHADGIYAGMGCKITGCSANNNKTGIFADRFCTVRDCTVLWNDQHGIRVQDSCRVEGNNCGNNGFGGSFGAGIYVMGAGNRIDNNNVNWNKRGILANTGGSGTGNLIIRNSASQNSEGNFVLDGNGGNFYGTIIPLSVGGAFTADAWANFQF